MADQNMTIRRSSTIDSEDLERYVSLAPLHQPNNLAPIRALLRAGRICLKLRASTRHSIADTMRWPIISPYQSRSMPKGVRRYGFHGLSYEYVADRLRQVAPEIASGRVIVAHLGSGASMCALAEWPQCRKHHGLYGP